MMEKQQLTQDIITLQKYINHIKETANDLVWEHYPNGEPTITGASLIELIDPGINPLLNSDQEWLEKLITYEVT